MTNGGTQQSIGVSTLPENKVTDNISQSPSPSEVFMPPRMLSACQNFTISTVTCISISSARFTFRFIFWVVPQDILEKFESLGALLSSIKDTCLFSSNKHKFLRFTQYWNRSRTYLPQGHNNIFWMCGQDGIKLSKSIFHTLSRHLVDTQSGQEWNARGGERRNTSCKKEQHFSISLTG